MFEQVEGWFGSGGQAKIETPIMQAAGGFHHQVIKTCVEIAENIMNNAKDFDAAQTVLDTDPFSG